MLLHEIINSIESVAPLEYQESWDNSGLQIGDIHQDINLVLLAIDVTEPVLNEAIERHCELIISHHPLFFHGVKALVGQTAQQRIIAKAVQHNIAIYSSHTAMDVAPNGVSWRMAQIMGLQNCNPLVPDANNHEYGFGIIGELPDPVSPQELLSLVKAAFGAPCIRYTESPKRNIRRIAMCGGAAADFLENAINAHADAYIAADMKYHELQPTVGLIMAIDLDHWISEQFTRDLFADILHGKVTTCIATSDKSHIRYYTE